MSWSGRTTLGFNAFSKIGALVAVVAVTFALGVASRVINISALDGNGKARTDDLLVVGVIANTSASRSSGAHYVRGIELWLSRVQRTNGIPYNRGTDGENLRAAVRVVVRNDRGRPDLAGRIADELIKQGASVIFGPPDPDELTRVADSVSASRGALLFSPIPRPVMIPEDRRATFLYRPPVGDLHAALDVVFLRPPRTRNGRFKRRIALLADRGEWALRAREGQILAKERAFDAQIIYPRGADVGPALGKVRHPLDAIITVAPISRAVQWFSRVRTESRVPWILVSADLAAAVPIARQSTVAVTVPWSPTSIGGGSIFPPLDFATTYEAVYGRIPAVDAAAGAALGALLSELVIAARSTDASRILRARDALSGSSLWGTLSFRRGEQAPFLPYVVLVDQGELLNIWPEPAQVTALRRSVPPSSGANR